MGNEAVKTPYLKRPLLQGATGTLAAVSRREVSVCSLEEYEILLLCSLEQHPLTHSLFFISLSAEADYTSQGAQLFKNLVVKETAHLNTVFV